MLENIKHLLIFKSIDKDINEKKYDIALEKLNDLINSSFNLEETYLKRGRLCHMLLMYGEAYSDYTYNITHYPNNLHAYIERAKLCYEINNYKQAIEDATKVLEIEANNREMINIKFLSFIFLKELENAKNYILNVFQNNKYKTIQVVLEEVAISLTKNELGKGLKLLEIIDMIDKDNPIMLLKKANIYELAGDLDNSNKFLKDIDSAFPKYFISHFKLKKMYQPKDLLEIYFLLELKIFDKQNLFDYPMMILEAYKNHIEGHIIDSKEYLEKAIKINPQKSEGYVLLAQTYQLMSGYDKAEYMNEAEKNYLLALEIYQKENLPHKVEEMKTQLKHINSRKYIYTSKK